MSVKKKQFRAIILLVCVLLATVVLFAGCKKKSEPAAAKKAEEAVSAAVEQTLCPVMAGPINKSFYTEYKGKKVYFCCAGCKEQFEKEPEKYLNKLPQFGK